MNCTQLVEIFENMGFEPRCYSGRGMYGAACLGVDTDEEPATFVCKLIATFCENATEVEEIADFVEAISWPSVDSMGRGAIVYWPSIAWEETDGE